MSYVICERAERIATLCLNRPEKRNAVNTGMLEELGGLCEELRRETDVRVVLLRGAGGYFCAGADLSQIGASDEGALRRFHDVRECTFELIEAFPCPTVAVIEGYALGTGLEMALCADFRIASAGALLGVPSSRLGIVESYGYLNRLVKAVGPARANFLVFTGERLPAGEARLIGLVEKVFPDEVFEEGVRALVEGLVGNASRAIRGSKRVIRECAADPHLEGVADPARPMVDSLGGREMQEGTRAFIEKRRAKFDP
ncbi:MAG: enoyl-CoA hydratase/isomerase family protein [Deltaproteobacteria bacterium]|nr:enoyl-CoA hydratase/isomerase family protein [Deltaproteobacteria bacterium]